VRFDLREQKTRTKKWGEEKCIMRFTIRIPRPILLQISSNELSGKCSMHGRGHEVYRVRIRDTLRLAVYRQSVRLGAKPFKTHDQYFFQLNTCGHSPYVTSSLATAWVCCLQLLLVIASAARVWFRRTHDHSLLSQIRYSPHLVGQVPVFVSHSNRVTQLHP
jgi:hypothetical protein